MALTQTEKQRRYRDRLKQKDAEYDRLLSQQLFRGAFSDFLKSKGQGGYTGNEVALGENWSDFSDDAGFEPLPGEDDEDAATINNSLLKADRMIDVLQDLLENVIADINEYKRYEIDARIAEIEQADLSDTEARKKAFADMARLKKMRDQLDKQVRWTFPQWKVTGE